MSTLPRPECVLDGSGPTTVVRCVHCGTSQTVRLPMEMKGMVSISKEFAKAHQLCPLTLAQLREMERMEHEALERTPPASKAYDSLRASLYRIQATIRRKGPDPKR